MAAGTLQNDECRELLCAIPHQSFGPLQFYRTALKTEKWKVLDDPVIAKGKVGWLDR